MRRIFAIFLVLMVTMSFLVDEEETYRYLPNTVFEPGEEIEYKVHYSIFTAASGRMVISDELHFFNGRPCYKIDVYGRSVGFFDFIIRIRDNWGSYLDTASIIPHKFYRTLEEGSYRKYETTEFDHDKDTATVITLDKKTKEIATIEHFAVANNSQDLVSGYYYLRLLDFTQYHIGDTITVDAFFDDEAYAFKIRYLGTDEVKTKIGKLEAIVLTPIMPENDLFDGDESIKVWISNDVKKIPIKVKAQMFIGAVEVDIISYKPG